MGTSTEHEYLCPHCGAENSLSDYEIRNMYSAQIAHCDNCKCKLEIVPADGIGDNINLVVSEAGEEALSR